MLIMRPWLLSIILGIALFNAPPARADVPQQIIDQIADLRVQETELKHLAVMGKLNDQDASTKKQAIEAQIKTLYLPYRAVSQAETDSARTAIDRLVADKLSLLRPQWIQEEAAVKAARDQAAVKNPDTPSPQATVAAAPPPVIAAAPPVAATAPPAPADVPQQIIGQIADLRVQQEELKHLTAIGKLTGADAVTKSQAIEAQIKTLYLPYRTISPAEDTRARAAIDRIAADKLSLLRPQWDQEEAAVTAARDQRSKQLYAEAEDDARAAAELQRQRAALQKQLAAGTLTQDAFAAQDKQASDAIAALRKKYADAGEQWPDWFEQRYHVQLEAALKNADTPLPQPSVAASSPATVTAPPDFAADVRAAADLAVKREENAYKFDKKQINQALMASTDAAIDLDLARLKARYDALVPKRGAEFEKAYLQAAAPRIQALKVQYYPERYRPAAVSAPAAPQKVVPIRSVSAFSTLSQWAIIIGVPVLGIWWWRGGVAKATKRLSPAIRRTAYAIGALVTLTLLCSAFGETAAAVIGLVGLGIWWLATSKSRAAKKQTKHVKWSNEKVWDSFPETAEERAQSIDKIFDLRNQPLSLFVAGPTTSKNRFVAEYFAPVANFSPKEREALRAAYHLYNLGMMPDGNFYSARTAIFLGTKKGLLNSEYKAFTRTPQSYGAHEPDAGMGITLNDLTNSLRRNPDHPLLRRLSARFHGDGGDLVPGAPLKSGAKGEPVEAGLVLGLDEKAPYTWWYYDGEGSLITVAPPGSGKTQSQVFPNLLMWKGAAVVLDVKGEIYEQTSEWRRQNVGPVYKFSPLDPATSDGFNPLTEVRADPDYLWEDARFLADMMIVPSGAKDPFWEHRARDVLTAAIASVCAEPDVAQRSMEAVLNILHGVDWDNFVEYLKARKDFPSMTRAGHSLASMEPKTRDGVLQSALSSMSAWDGERIARATRKSDWSPLDLRDGTNPTIYICLRPNEVDSYISMLRVFIAQHIRSLTSTAVPAHGVHPILFMLDELPRLRHMPPIEEALEIGRQYGIKLWLFAQSLGQLKTAYPNAEGMIGGCAIRMFMNPSLHDETAQKVSDDIGFQESVIDATRVKIVEPNVLAGPDYKDVVIVMAANARAARLKKYFAYEDDAFKARMGSSERVEAV
jgi:hypothetical protein